MPPVTAGEREETAVVDRGTGERRRARLGRSVQRFGLLGVWVAVAVTFSLLEPDSFPTSQNFQTIFSSQAVLLVLAMAALVPLIAGDLDLSFAGMMGISVVLVGYLNVEQGWPIALVAVAVILAGLIVGLVNATVVVVVGVDSIVATLGMGTLLAGLALGITNLPISGVSPALVDVTTFKVLGLQTSFLIALVICIAAWFALEHMPVGRRLYFVGAGRDVARLSGIPAERFRAAALVVASTLSAVGGIMLAGLLGSADPSVGPGFLLPALAAVFLGATAVAPGRFNVWGTFIAVYFLVTGITGLQMVGLSGWISQAFYGGALIVAVVLSRIVGLGLEAGAQAAVRKGQA